ncbi:pimeloyl-ACP methyl ester carboxylesterase [Wenyingzhuangia heitensis]|uniref:Pimeloyl-ACP methyl ester carboxylesterase n=1 Tax=Wenyingzhuangia heitensis TaxID=1487859 RepID=A0ABX0UBG9_9FLAO|nr:alpha/beta hydrolase [Wenyingzhuangia heitensis]NIJ46168.1 pimeloyl-ACP methyl ester carboxylesterase [Wenyingzhuangia heitensis]
MKKHLYFIPGTSASSKIFERIKLPKHLFEIHLLDWIQPLHKNESIASYTTRLSTFVKEPNPIFVGVSFGGIIAQELTKHFKGSKVVLVSSIKHQDEVTPFLKFVRKTKLYKIYPVSFINLTEKIMYRFATKKLKRTLDSYRYYLSLRNKTYTQWAIQSFVTWKQNQPINTLHLHGTKDFVLPVKNIKNVTLINGGTHAMILTKSTTIQHKIINYLA